MRSLVCAFGFAPSIQQHRDDLEAGGRVGGGQLHAPTLRQRVHVHGGVERRLAVEVPQVHVGAAFDEERRGVPVDVHQRHDQRRDVIRVAEVDVRLGLQQFLHAGMAAFARRIEQRL